MLFNFVCDIVAAVSLAGVGVDMDIDAFLGGSDNKENLVNAFIAENTIFRIYARPMIMIIFLRLGERVSFYLAIISEEP